MSDTNVPYDALTIAACMQIGVAEARIMAAAFVMLAALQDAVASASPSKEEHPAMYAAWLNMRAAIAQATLPNAVSVSAGAGPEGGKPDNALAQRGAQLASDYDRTQPIPLDAAGSFPKEKK